MPDNIANPSNIAALIGGIMESKNRIKTKLLDLGLAAANDSLYDLSYEITDIANNGAISATVQEGTSYTIPSGYHNGAGVVTGIAGGGNYQLQAKGPITPTKSQQQITSDEGYYGLSGVTIDPIPDAYQDVSSVTAQASQVLATKIFVNSAGSIVTGTMTNNGAVNQTISVATPSYTIPSGYHNGSGKVSLVTETKAVTPSATSQDITPTSGKVLSKVTVNAMPPGAFSGADNPSISPLIQVTSSGKINVTSSSYLELHPVTTNGYLTTSDTYFPLFTITSSLQLSTHGADTITPTTSEQIAVASGKYTTGIVKVAAIPSAYQDVSEVTTTPSQVLEGTYFVNSSGSVLEGTMAINSAETIILDAGFGKNQWYDIPEGYHNGEGTVRIVLETKSATPSTASQDITPTSGKVLSKVTVAAIPSAYQDVTGVTAAASQVLAGTSYVTSDGTLTAGTMTNRGAVSKTLDATSGNQTYTIQSGYHNGSGSVSITLETKSATPSTVSQDITPTSGKVLSKVAIAAIPSAYQDVTGVTATASQVLSGASYVTAAGVLTAGTMANVGAQVSAIDGLTVASKLITQGYHDGTGYIYLTNDIETALASI